MRLPILPVILRRNLSTEVAEHVEEHVSLEESKRLALRVPENITVVELPPCSPELNPIENLWHYLKSHFWSNRAYADYDELEHAAMQARKQAALDEDLVKSVCAAPCSERASSD